MADPKTPTSESPKPLEGEVNSKPDEQKNLDRDGGEKQPSDQSPTS